MLRANSIVYRYRSNVKWVTAWSRLASTGASSRPAAAAHEYPNLPVDGAPLVNDATAAASTAASQSSSFISDAADSLLSAHNLLTQDGSLVGWCGTIIGTAIAARVAGLPLLYYTQVQHARAARATTELARVQAFVRRSPGSLLQKYLSFRRLRSVALRSAGTSPARLFPWYAVVNVPVFVTASLAIRHIAHDPPSTWANAGVQGWFEDLSAADPTGALPIANTALWLYNAHMRRPAIAAKKTDAVAEENAPDGLKASMPKDPSAGMASDDVPRKLRSNAVLDRLTSGETMTTGLQALALFSFPFLQNAPSGMFVFWITSGTLTALQRALLSSDFGRRALGLPTASELARASKEDGPDVLRATGRAVKAIREQLEYVQADVLSKYSERRIDEDLCSEVNRALTREKHHGRISIDLEAFVRNDHSQGRKYLAIVRKGTDDTAREN